MKKFEFSYKDNEGDLFESDQYDTLNEARAEIARLRDLYDGDFEVVETWIYKDDEFVGRW